MKAVRLITVAVGLLIFSGCALKVKNVKPDKPYDFAGIVNMARYAQAAYADEATIRALCRPDFSDVYIRVIVSTNNQFFLATSTTTKTQLISIAGTTNVENVLLDANFSQGYSLELRIPLHRGFSQAAGKIYDDVKPRLLPGYHVQVTGHSLGGAEALILGMLLQASGNPVERIVTFGQPKVCTQDGVKAFRNLPLTRVVNQDDLIPELPLDPYRHIGAELVLFSGPTYSVVKARPIRPEKLVAAWQALRRHQIPAQFQNHYIANYLVNLDSKVAASELVPYPKN